MMPYPDTHHIDEAFDVSKLALQYHLTRQEYFILYRLAQGYSPAMLANDLDCTIRTLQRKQHHIVKKMQAVNVLNAISRFAKADL